MWDKRYDQKEYVYGTRPNDYLVDMAHRLPPGRILCLAEGEGRNAVYLAGLGYEVTCVDSSEVGLTKAEQLARKKQVALNIEVADLADYTLPRHFYSGIVSIFAHLPPAIRTRVHSQVVTALLPGGVLLLEAYTPDQLNYGTGGPPSAEMMMQLSQLKDELHGLDFIHARELVREINEGLLNNGKGSVVQVLARKPGGGVSES